MVGECLIVEVVGNCSENWMENKCEKIDGYFDEGIGKQWIV